MRLNEAGESQVQGRIKARVDNLVRLGLIRKKESWGYISVVEYVPGMHEVMGSIPIVKKAHEQNKTKHFTVQ